MAKAKLLEGCYVLRYKVKGKNLCGRTIEAVVDTPDVGEAINSALEKYLEIYDITISTKQCPLCRKVVDG